MSKEHSNQYKASSITLSGAVAMGTGVMIGAGVLALTGQVAELAREWFPFAFLVAAIISSFSAYSYVKLSNAFPSAGGIAMFLEKAYGKGTMTAACALLMYFSMVINESLVARTFGTYSLQLFDIEKKEWMIAGIGIGLLAIAFLVNVLGNRTIQAVSYFMAFIKVGGLVLLSIGGLWASGVSFESISIASGDTSVTGFLGAVALGILAYKGFTTITNSGSEIRSPSKNIGRAIIISLIVCAAIYLLVAFAVGGNLSISEIVNARDYALAEAARPAFGKLGLWVTC